MDDDEPEATKYFNLNEVRFYVELTDNVSHDGIMQRKATKIKQRRLAVFLTKWKCGEEPFVKLKKQKR